MRIAGQTVILLAKFQTLLNLAEFMEHCEGDVPPLPIDPVRLGERAMHCRAYAKALHYKEYEFHKTKEPTAAIYEALISINNKLQQKEAAAGKLFLYLGYRISFMSVLDFSIFLTVSVCFTSPFSAGFYCMLKKFKGALSKSSSSVNAPSLGVSGIDSVCINSDHIASWFHKPLKMHLKYVSLSYFCSHPATVLTIVSSAQHFLYFQAYWNTSSVGRAPSRCLIKKGGTKNCITGKKPKLLMRID